MTKPKKQIELEEKVTNLTADLQRMRADFENYRKRVDIEKRQAHDHGCHATILKLLPVIDNIERAIAHVPDSLKSDPWAKGVISLVKNLDKSMDNLKVKRINARKGDAFNPELHEAVQMEEGDGEKEVIAEELQAGYILDGEVVRPSMVKVTKK